MNSHPLVGQNNQNNPLCSGNVIWVEFTRHLARRVNAVLLFGRVLVIISVAYVSHWETQASEALTLTHGVHLGLAMQHFIAGILRVLDLTSWSPLTPNEGPVVSSLLAP